MKNYEEFCKAVKENILGVLPVEFSDSEVDLNRVQKIEGERIGLVVRKPGSNVSPTVYLEECYKTYEKMINESNKQEETAFGCALKGIADCVIEHQVSSIDIGYIQSWEEVKTMIEAKLIPITDSTRDYLEGKVHSIYMDEFAILYMIDVPNMEGGTITVTDTIFEKWGISLEEIDRAARNNIADKFMIRSMRDTIHMISPDLICDAIDFVDDCGMNILSNKDLTYGSIHLINDKALSRIQEKLDGDFYILPSSVHELIVVPASICEDVADLKAMVREVNDTQVRPEDRLSYNVFEFSNGKLQVAA